jgi:Fe2+ transport system protein FeoA
LLRRWIHGNEIAGAGVPWPAPATLADVPAGWKARLSSWKTTPARRRQQLRAYGLAEGCWMVILQHTPTTILRVGRTELALERELAASIIVEDAQPAAAAADRPSVVA